MAAQAETMLLLRGIFPSTFKHKLPKGFERKKCNFCNKTLYVCSHCLNQDGYYIVVVCPDDPLGYYHKYSNLKIVKNSCKPGAKLNA